MFNRRNSVEHPIGRTSFLPLVVRSKNDQKPPIFKGGPVRVKSSNWIKIFLPRDSSSQKPPVHQVSATFLKKFILARLTLLWFLVQRKQPFLSVTSFYRSIWYFRKILEHSSRLEQSDRSFLSRISRAQNKMISHRKNWNS